MTHSKDLNDKQKKSRRVRSRAAYSEHDPSAVGYPNNSITGIPITFKILGKVIDSAYVSQSGRLDDFQKGMLDTHKKYAQSDKLEEKNLSQISLGENHLEILPFGTRNFPYILTDSRFHIQLNSGTGAIPYTYTQIASDYLLSSSLEEAVAALESITGALGTVSYTTVNRVDLAIDVATDYDFSTLLEPNFVGRSPRFVRYADNGFEGLMIGKGAIVFRLYNKLREIEASDKGYMREIWKEAGWDGETPVYRFEFQLRKEALKQFKLEFAKDIVEKQGSLWGYCTRKWLRIVSPGNHNAKDRWPTQPFWEEVQRGFGFTPALPRLKKYSATRAPENWYFFGQAGSASLGYMAKYKLTDFQEAWAQYGRELEQHYIKKLGGKEAFEKYITEQVNSRRKRYGLQIENDEEIPL